MLSAQRDAAYAPPHLRFPKFWCVSKGWRFVACGWFLHSPLHCRYTTSTSTASQVRASAKQNIIFKSSQQFPLGVRRGGPLRPSLHAPGPFLCIRQRIIQERLSGSVSLFQYWVLAFHSNGVSHTCSAVYVGVTRVVPLS